MRNKETITRWILVIPSAFLGWYAALLIGMVLYVASNHFCPPENMYSGLCMAEWSSLVLDGILIVSAGLSAVLTLLFPVLMAPDNRILVAKFIFVGGFGCALYTVYYVREWGPFISAVISGVIFLIFLLKYLERGKS